MSTADLIMKGNSVNSETGHSALQNVNSRLDHEGELCELGDRSYASIQSEEKMDSKENLRNCRTEFSQPTKHCESFRKKRKREKEERERERERQSDRERERERERESFLKEIMAENVLNLEEIWT
jgi:hypothetical protein